MMKKLFLLIACLFTSMFVSAQNEKYKTVDSAEFAKFLSEKGVQLVDVRTADEFKQGHLKDAMNMNVQATDFDKKSETLKKDKPVAIYCRSGKRSKTAAEKLVAKGYTVVELKGGITAWTGKIVKE